MMTIVLLSGIWKSQEDYLFLYCALEAYVTNNGTTIPSPVDIDAWGKSSSDSHGYQLNGCVRVSRVYTDSVSKVFGGGDSMTESLLRVPPDGQESAALLKHAEALNGVCHVSHIGNGNGNGTMS
jgi:hypothetical protein